MAKKPSWRAKAMYVIFALALVAGLVPLVAAPVVAQPPSIAVYGPTVWTAGQPCMFWVVAAPATDSAGIDWTAAGGNLPSGNIAGPTEGNTFTTTFAAAGPHIVTVTGHWGGLAPTDSITVTIQTSLLPAVAFNVLNVEETFCVPTDYLGDVTDWDWTQNFPNGGSVDIDPDNPTTENCVRVRSPNQGDVLLEAETTGGPPANLYGEKKWGKIDETIMSPSGASQIWWDENEKEWDGETEVFEMVIGRFFADPPDTFIYYPADGAVVEWWLVDARAPVTDMCGTYAEMRSKVTNLAGTGWYDRYEANRVVFCENDETYYQSTSGDYVVPNMPDFNVPGLTSAHLCADGEESVKVIVLASYPNMQLLPQETLCLEHTSWNFWTQEVEKVPQVRWAGEKIVLEKEFGSNYIGDDVSFKLENQSVGTLEGVYTDDWPDQAQTVWTTVQSDGVTRCILTSESPGECDVTVTLWDGDMIVNQHGFVVFFLKFEDIYLGELLGNRTGHNEGLWVPENPWDISTDLLTDTLNVSEDALIRARVSGWFMGDNLSWRDDVVVDMDGDGFAETRLPEGRWVLPQDWRIMAGADWQTRRPHWEIMSSPLSDVASYPTDGVYNPFTNTWTFTKVAELGDYVTWGMVGPNDAPVPNNYVPGDPLNIWAARYPVIGPYNSLDDYTPFVNNMVPTSLPGYMYRKTIVRDLALDWWDCPMPPAKIAFEIVSGPGFFKDMDKGDAYYIWKTTSQDPPVPDGIVYTNPFYAEEIPASSLIPPFINNGGYDWDSWGWTIPYGPYPFWQIINQPRATDDPQHPTKVEVYSDNHGEAMVWLNGFWDLDLSNYAAGGGFDVPFGEEVGETAVKVTGDYPYLRKHIYVANPTDENLIKTWTWGKTVIGADRHYFNYPGVWDFDPLYEHMLFQVGSVLPSGLSDMKMAFIWVSNADGFPAVNEQIDWVVGDFDGHTFIPDVDANPYGTPPTYISTYGAGLHLMVGVQDGFLAGTGGVITDDVWRMHGTSYTRLPTSDEMDLFVKFQTMDTWPLNLDPEDFAVAGVVLYSSTSGSHADLSARVDEGPVIGPVFRHWNVVWSVADPTDDPTVRGDADMNGGVNMGDVVKVERVILGLSVATSNADANRNGSVDMGDVTKIERTILGI